VSDRADPSSTVFDRSVGTITRAENGPLTISEWQIYKSIDSSADNRTTLDCTRSKRNHTTRRWQVYGPGESDLIFSHPTMLIYRNGPRDLEHYHEHHHPYQNMRSTPAYHGQNRWHPPSGLPFSSTDSQIRVESCTKLTI
jgi:hypothetical protein